MINIKIIKITLLDQINCSLVTESDLLQIAALITKSKHIHRRLLFILMAKMFISELVIFNFTEFWLHVGYQLSDIYGPCTLHLFGQQIPVWVL